MAHAGNCKGGTTVADKSREASFPFSLKGSNFIIYLK